MGSIIAPIVQPRVLVLCLVLVVLGGLAGCGSVHEPGPQTSSCGTLALPRNASADQSVANYDGQIPKAVEDCFVQAFQQCKSMSLTTSVLDGVDTSTSTTYTIQPTRTGCQIVASSQFHVVGVPPHTPPATTTTCQGLRETTDAVILTNCGGSNVVIPRREACGVVDFRAPPGGKEEKETCFAQAYQDCYPAGLEYISSAALYEFQISSACQLTLTVNGAQPATPCASLTQQADGLHVLGCGAQGDLLVPATP